ncbi:MAG: cytochrome ubiquinol oxidase subunit I, partial [Muribaculaceae bacterium]|nr:cytochrome ubiquinol oxidase subunit I [Muribaculaceae bacterium]
SYAERIERGKLAQAALRNYDIAMENGDSAAMNVAKADLQKNFQYFGYGYFDDVKEAIPPIGVTFWTFRIMCYLGGYFLLFFVVILFLVYRTRLMERATWIQWIAMASVPLMWVCSEAGWAVAEVGRQPWTVQDLLPTKAAISEIPASSVIITFWLFALVFTVLLVAEVSIMCRQISKESKKNLSPNKA